MTNPYDSERIGPREAGIATTIHDLGRALRSIGMNPSVEARASEAARQIVEEAERRRKPRPAIDEAIARIERAATRSVDVVDAPFVDRMVEKPFLIASAIYGPRSAFWPPLGKSIARVVADCDAALAKARETPSDMRRIEELRRARKALERLET